jgi:hypothetical protein
MPAISAEAKLVIGTIAGFFGLLVPVLISPDTAMRFMNWIRRKIFRKAVSADSGRSPLRWVLLTIFATFFVVGGAIVAAAPTSPGSANHTPTPTHTISAASSPVACVCESGTVTDTLSCLINTESDAANRGDPVLIARIFAPTAHIYRGDTKQEWDSPLAYYLPTLKTLHFFNAVHYDIQPVTVTANSAWTTSGSRGSYAPASGGTSTPYDNLNPSDHWLFEKNESGCWVITRYEFNAMTLPFPPTP